MKRVLITGANKGIGYNMAKQLLADGYAVSVIDTETDNLNELTKSYEGRLLPLRCDVRSDEAMAKAVALSVNTFGSIDIAVHNACKCDFKPPKKRNYPNTAIFSTSTFTGLSGSLSSPYSTCRRAAE